MEQQGRYTNPEHLAKPGFADLLFLDSLAVEESTGKEIEGYGT
jgi:hypothetical protein